MKQTKFIHLAFNTYFIAKIKIKLHEIIYVPTTYTVKKKKNYFGYFKKIFGVVTSLCLLIRLLSCLHLFY